eukprot:6214476-Pleurochrysis_carterae.AAC.5
MAHCASVCASVRERACLRSISLNSCGHVASVVTATSAACNWPQHLHHAAAELHCGRSFSRQALEGGKYYHRRGEH